MSGHSNPGGRSAQEAALAVLYIAFPVATVAVVSSMPLWQALARSPSRRITYRVSSTNAKWLKTVSPLVVLAFIGQGIVEATSINHDAKAPVLSETLYCFASILIWSCISIFLAEGESPCWPAYMMAWAAGAVSDAVILSLAVSDVPALDARGFSLVSLQAGRFGLFCTASVSCCAAMKRGPKPDEAMGEENSCLLSNSSDCHDDQEPGLTSTSYGSIRDVHGAADGRGGRGDDDDDDDSTDDEGEGDIKEQQKRRLEEAGGWMGYLKTLLVFMPVILPYKHLPTQIWVLVMLLCIGAQRVLTYMIPKQFSILTEAVSHSFVTGRAPWKEFITWAALNFPLASTLEALTSMASTRISQFAYQQLTALAFHHVMNLSMDYHTSKSTGRVVKAIEQGSNLGGILDIVYHTAPIMIDFFVAVVVLSSKFDANMGFVILATFMLHLYAAYKGNIRTAKIERQVNDTSRGENETLFDSITNWQTVAYHNRQRHEETRYTVSISKAVRSERALFDFYEYISMTESGIMQVGLVAAAGLVLKRVAQGTDSFASFVFLVSYWDTIRSPMSMLAWTLRSATTHVIDAEWLYQLIQTKPSVQDKDGAPDIRLGSGGGGAGGKVDFQNVSFSYDPARPILKDITFTAEPGQRIALVGETGGGKSTLLKLLFRFYDVSRGSISIDGQDIRDVTLSSLRDILGLVPQEPAVFDRTLMDNLLFARPGATEAEAIEACKAARIHQQIVRFPDGYRTRLGERGVRLSGGELQRLAIARVILRRPQIVVLDEATSAVDSETEAAIQQAIGELSSGRTVFMIAHRLSTVVSADLILVIDQGAVVERGTHAELLALGGKYARLWNIQTTA